MHYALCIVHFYRLQIYKKNIVYTIAIPKSIKIKSTQSHLSINNKDTQKTISQSFIKRKLKIKKVNLQQHPFYYSTKQKYGGSLLRHTYGKSIVHLWFSILKRYYKIPLTRKNPAQKSPQIHTFQ